MFEIKSPFLYSYICWICRLLDRIKKPQNKTETNGQTKQPLNTPHGHNFDGYLLFFFFLFTCQFSIIHTSPSSSLLEMPSAPQTWTSSASRSTAANLRTSIVSSRNVKVAAVGGQEKPREADACSRLRTWSQFFFFLLLFLLLPLLRCSSSPRVLDRSYSDPVCSPLPLPHTPPHPPVVISEYIPPRRDVRGQLRHTSPYLQPPEPFPKDWLFCFLFPNRDLPKGQRADLPKSPIKRSPVVWSSEYIKGKYNAKGTNGQFLFDKEIYQNHKWRYLSIFLWYLLQCFKHFAALPTILSHKTIKLTSWKKEKNLSLRGWVTQAGFCCYYCVIEAFG